MNDLAMQNESQADIVWFVNCRGCGWVIGIEPISWDCSGVAHLVKVNVRLVSFPRSSVRNDLALELRSAA